MLKSEINKSLGVTESQRELFNYFVRALFNSRLGKLTKQEFDLDAQYMPKVSSVWKLFVYFEKIGAKNWLNLNHAQKWIENFFRDTNPIVQPLVLFCPSYIKDGTPGLNENIGNTTKIGVKNTITFIEQVKLILGEFVDVKPVIHLGSLGLEQYSQKDDNYWLGKIENNKKEIEKEFKECGYPVNIVATHNIQEQKDRIGFIGATNADLVSKNESKVKAVFDRNRTFYMENLGWSQEDSDSRTKSSIATYNELGHYYSKNLKNPIFFYTANSYEKAIAYNLENQNLLIIYPKKDAQQNIVNISTII